MSNAFTNFARRRPTAARWIVIAEWVAVVAAIIAISIVNIPSWVLVCLACALTGAWGYSTAADRYKQRLRDQVAEARRDTLTGLPTRRTADELLDAATREATTMSVALADVDGLHAINSSLGYTAGDLYLRVIAWRLSRAVPAGGCLARQGGNEFILLAPNTSPQELATRIGAAMAGPATIGGRRFQPRASVGVATSNGGDARYTRACADAAMYSAKAAGGNHTMVYDPDRDGRPHPDGTRPLRRRRDINPLGADAVAWQPAPGDELLPILWSVSEARTVHAALDAARTRWEQAVAEAEVDAVARQPQTPQPTVPVRLAVGSTRAGYRDIARTAEVERARYARLADRLALIIEAAQPFDEAQP